MIGADNHYERIK